MTTKQDKDPYIWDYNIKVKTKDGYDYEEETKVKEKKLKIGEYVRNKYGIAKIIDIKTNDEGIDICYFDNDIAFIFDTKLKEEKYRTHILPLTNNVDINKLKHSPNIIDLIEVGDILSFEDGSICRIMEIDNDLNPPYYLLKDYGGDTYWERQEYLSDLKSIVTKEQFESMEYKINE